MTAWLRHSIIAARPLFKKASTNIPIVVYEDKIMTNETLSLPALTKSVLREACADLLIGIAVSNATHKILYPQYKLPTELSNCNDFLDIAKKISSKSHMDEGLYVFSNKMVEEYAKILYAEAVEVGITNDSLIEIANHFRK